MRKNYKSSVFQNKVLVIQILLDHLPNTSPRRRGNSHFCDSWHIILLNYCGHHLKDFQVKRASGQQYKSTFIIFKVKKYSFSNNSWYFWSIFKVFEVSEFEFYKYTSSTKNHSKRIIFSKIEKTSVEKYYLAFLDKMNIEIFGLRYIFPHLYFRIDNIPMLLSQTKLYRILFF